MYVSWPAKSAVHPIATEHIATQRTTLCANKRHYAVLSSDDCGQYGVGFPPGCCADVGSRSGRTRSSRGKAHNQRPPWLSHAGLQDSDKCGPINTAHGSRTKTSCVSSCRSATRWPQDSTHHESSASCRRAARRTLFTPCSCSFGFLGVATLFYDGIADDGMPEA